MKGPRLRLPDEMLGRPARRRGAARPRRRDSPSSYRQGLLLGFCLGTTFALVLGVTAFVVTRPDPSATGRAGGGRPVGGPAPSAATAQPRANVGVSARNLGDLQVHIEATVSAPGSYNPITKGQVMAYLDMIAMPRSHRKGPIIMAEVGGRPGVYQAVGQVPMAGEYDVQVEVRQPMPAEAHARVAVGTVATAAPG
ncbi:hypothetical protein [Micromonospora sp. NPDC006431]|uniref:hypothetical protein n=1 Tax=Micromonospora sp. NPDC006431 TaxID=3364235 RepID=UPI0036A8DCBF